jgi:phosphatidylserine/phosphatidylglycerophosphate/cardiolipin synthase-like enzyme
MLDNHATIVGGHNIGDEHFDARQEISQKGEDHVVGTRGKRGAKPVAVAGPYLAPSPHCPTTEPFRIVPSRR